MGCNIHLHSEVKINGQWHHHSDCSVKKSYRLFAKMANVRNWDESGINPISEPKGLPDDATFLTKLHSEKYGIDGHSHSWLDKNEIVILHDFVKSQEDLTWTFEHQNLPYFMGNHLDGFVNYPEDWKDYNVEDVRYVFFFDN